MNNNGYAYFYTTFRYYLWYHAYHVPLRYPLGYHPFTTSVDRLTCLGLCGMYNPVSDSSSVNNSRPQATFYIFCGCVVCSGMIAAVNLPLTFLYSIVWKTTHPPTLHHG